MVAWTGFGWLGYLIVVVSVPFAGGILEDLFGLRDVRQYPVALAGSAFVVSSLLCYPVGRFFNRRLPMRVFDPDWAWKGRTTAHSTFFVRLEFAGLVGLPYFILLAIVGWENLH